MDPRGTTNERGYGADHDRERARWAPVVAAGGVVCARCPDVIEPDQPWHLDHTDDRTRYLGPSHRRCNIAAAAPPPRRRPAEPHPGLTPTPGGSR